MSSSVQLICVRPIAEISDENEFIWMYQRSEKWIPFPARASSSIETAFRQNCDEVFVDQIHRIDLKYFFEENVNDPNFKGSIRRRRRLSQSSISNEEECRRCERFSFHLGFVSNCNATVDTNYYGSPFIAEWFLTFTKGKRNITFQSIFSALLQGLQEEGQNEPICVINDIINNLNQVREKVFRQNEKKRMEELENSCAELYTKSCFIHGKVNTALRNNDQRKQDTLGPYCFLLFNYIGRHFIDDYSIYYRLKNIFRSSKTQSMKVYRGDYISPQMLEQYTKAIGNNSQYFKWLPFVSTSRDQRVAQGFAQNALYIIQFQRSLLKDQFVDISIISTFKQEEEILLQPGVRFQVDKILFDYINYLHLIYIDIVPSYISTLR